MTIKIKKLESLIGKFLFVIGVSIFASMSVLYVGIFAAALIEHFIGI